MTVGHRRWSRRRSRRPAISCTTTASEPPPKPDVEAVRGFYNGALAALPHIVDLHGNVRIRIIGRPCDPRVAVELLQRQVPGGHPELRVEVLVADEADQVPGRSVGPHRVGR